MITTHPSGLPTADLHISSGSEYGVRLDKDADVKARVGQAVVKNVLLREGFDPKKPVFISDGSSASVVFWHFMKAYLARPYNGELNILTNNFDVPMQVLCEPGAAKKVAIQFAPGLVRAEYCGVYGHSTDEWIKTNCVGATCVMAVTGLDAELGPTAKHPDAKKRKAAIMGAAGQLVIVATGSKLRKRQDVAAAVSPNDWKEWLNNRKGRLHVVTARTNGLTLTDQRFPLEPGSIDKRTDDQIEQENHHDLRTKLTTDYYILV